MAKRVVFFNHKGGVSKTTSVYNVGWMLSRNRRVLIVDADPQCNLTSLILRDGFEEFYINPRTAQQNIKDGVKVAFEGKPVPIQAVDCQSPARAPNLFLLPGHANLSEYDAALTFAQNSNNAFTTLQNLPGAFTELLRLTELKYNIDYTLIDLNPSLSAINQNLFITSDAFIIPTNPDPFSIMAMQTLSAILPRWVKWAQSAVPTFAEATYPLPLKAPKLLGTLIQRFNVRQGRAAMPYRNNIAEIQTATAGLLLSSLQQSGMALSDAQYSPDLVNAGYCLALISDFHGLLPKSNNAGVPVFELLDSEIAETGPVLEGMQLKRDGFRDDFVALATKIEQLMTYA